MNKQNSNVFYLVDPPKRGRPKLSISSAQRAFIVEQHIEKGLTTQKIAELHDLKPYAIESIIRKAGFKVSNKKRGRPSTSENPSDRAIAMASMIKEGSTLEEVGDLYGLTKERVRQIIKPLGVTGKHGQSMRAEKNAAKKNQRLEQARNLKAMKYWGVDHKRLMRLKKHNPADVKGYEQQRNNSLRRGVEWRLSIDEWMDMWKRSGKKRWKGRGANKYVLTRKRGRGPFSVENCIVAKQQDSSRSFILNNVHGIDYDPVDESKRPKDGKE